MGQAPSITDINIAKRVKELKNFKEGIIDDDDDNDDENGPPPISPAPPAPTSFQSRPSVIFSTPQHTPAVDDDDDNDYTNLNAAQRFLL